MDHDYIISLYNAIGMWRNVYNIMLGIFKSNNIIFVNIIKIIKVKFRKHLLTFSKTNFSYQFFPKN